MLGLSNLNTAFQIVGKSHDAKVFKASDLYQVLVERLTTPGRPLMRTFHILGDAAFPLKREIQVPYKMRGGPLTAEQKAFNRALSSKRQVIERYKNCMTPTMFYKYLNVRHFIPFSSLISYVIKFLNSQIIRSPSWTVA